MKNNNISMAEISLTEEEIGAAVDVLKSGALRQGKLCADFENKFAEKVSAKYAITCSSGSAALHLAYMAALKHGDEILVPSFTFIATASMASIAGMKPVFCDVNPDNWCIDLEDCRAKLTKKTKAIAPVHIFGNACDIDGIKSFAAEHGLKIIWDAAQAHGTEYNGHDIGSYDDMVCYSFYPSKNMFVGEGGMVVLNNAEWAEKIRFLRSHGQTGKYYHTMLGLNYRMTDVEAAIGLKQLDRLDEMLNKRRNNAARLTSGLEGISGVTLQKLSPECTHAFHQFCIVIDKKLFGMDRNDLSTALGEQGIATGVHYPRGVHQQPIFMQKYGQLSLPVCEKICNEILALPVHHGLSESEVDYIVEAIQELSL